FEKDFSTASLKERPSATRCGAARKNWSGWLRCTVSGSSWDRNTLRFIFPILWRRSALRTRSCSMNCRPGGTSACGTAPQEGRTAVMFAARGVVVSLAFFVMLYCALSSLVVLAWHCVNRAARKSSLGSASFLFALRIFSFAVSVVVAVFFAFPSFWLMESASLDEDAGTFILAACSLLILSAGLFRVLRAQARTKR